MATKKSKSNLRQPSSKNGQFVKLFVYGLLRKGYGLNSVHLGEEVYLGRAKTKKKYALYSHGLPYVIKDEHISPISGELYLIKKEKLADIDKVEGHPHMYKREQVDVITKEGNEYKAWLYFYPKAIGYLIEGGDYEDMMHTPVEPLFPGEYIDEDDDEFDEFL